MNYYFNYTTGLIDGLLMRAGIEDYVLVEGTEDPRFNEIPNKEDIQQILGYSKLINKKVKRNNWLDTKMTEGRLYDQSRAKGESYIPLDAKDKSYLRDWLDKQESDIFNPSTESKIDYTKEYKSPFSNELNKMLLLLKWISGIQSITQDIVTITKEDLKAIDMDHKSPMDIKIAFETVFPKSIVNSMYHDKAWHVKLGSRDLRVGEGPGYINMRVSIPHLVDKITEYHNNLKQTQQ